MATWKANLYFDDRIGNRKQKINFAFPALYRYKLLYDNLETLFKYIGWDGFEYEKYKVVFKLSTYKDEPVDIEDLNKYILNRDKINIIIFDPKIINYSLYTERGDILLTTSSLQSIYSDINIDNLNEVLKLYAVNESGTQLKLLDIIINPKMYYNQAVNRLIHNYYDKYNITI